MGTLVRDLQYLISNRTDFTIIGLDEKCSQIIYVKDLDGLLHKSRRNNLIRGVQLGAQSAIDRKKYYIIKFNKVHNFKYQYKDFIFDKKNGNYKVNIICPKHGEFWQDITDHTSGHGCNKCANRLRKGYTKSQWINFCKKTGRLINTVYLIRCFDDKEEFLKIGITTRTVNYRFHGQMMPYNYEVIKEYNYSPEIAFDIERGLHKKYKQYKYKPIKSFGGSKECFCMDLLNNIKLK